MGNYVACKVVGIGTMKLKMYDGIIRTFDNVRYAPTLEKNLISLGTRCEWLHIFFKRKQA